MSPVKRFITTDVFTSTRFGGNQLAVIPDARGLTTDAMQTITREFGYSESVFVFPPDDPGNTARLRIFTPALEMPFAGHPTVGAAIELAAEGIVTIDDEGSTAIVLEEGVGPVSVTLSKQKGLLFAELTAAVPPERVDGVVSRETLAKALGIHPNDFDGSRDPAVYSCGVPFTFLSVRDRSVLARIRFDRATFTAEVGASPGPQVFVLCNDPEDDSHDLRARMFAPTLGVDEDPATGAACAALNGYLGHGLDDGEHRWVVEQGYEMGRPSQIRITAVVRDGRVVESRVGGHAVRFAEGTLTAA